MVKPHPLAIYSKQSVLISRTLRVLLIVINPRCACAAKVHAEVVYTHTFVLQQGVHIYMYTDKCISCSAHKKEFIYMQMLY